MITELIVKAKDLFSADSGDIFELHNFKGHSRLFNSTEHQRQNRQQLDKLLVAYIFHNFTAEHFGSEQNQSSVDHQVLSNFKSPTYREMMLKKLPISIYKILQHSRVKSYLQPDANNQKIGQQLLLSPTLKQQILIVANQLPFTQKYPVLNDYTEITELFSTEDFLAVTCTAILHNHCLHESSDRTEHELFAQGASNAYINMQIAIEHKQDPLKAFICGFLTYMSLFYIYRELKTLQHLPSQNHLLNEIYELLPRLNYWIAKDWGLPDALLSILKERIQQPEHLSGIATDMQMSEHVNLALTLFKNKLLNRKQALLYLEQMNLAQHHFLQQATASTH